MNDDFFSVRIYCEMLIKTFFFLLICFCFDDNQSKQVVILLSMIHVSLMGCCMGYDGFCELQFIVNSQRICSRRRPHLYLYRHMCEKVAWSSALRYSLVRSASTSETIIKIYRIECRAHRTLNQVPRKSNFFIISFLRTSEMVWTKGNVVELRTNNKILRLMIIADHGTRRPLRWRPEKKEKLLMVIDLFLLHRSRRTKVSLGEKWK